MNYPSLNRTLLAGVVISLCSGLFAPVALAACDGTDLNTCPAPFDKQLPDTHKMLTWSQADRVVGFRNDYRNYAGDVFHHGNATPLPSAEKPLTDARYQVNGKSYNLQDYLKRQNVSGMLVLKDGKIAWKYLGEGNTDTTLWTSRSVGKSVVSTLVGVALKEGKNSLTRRPGHAIRARPERHRLGRRDVKTADHPHLRRGMERRLHQSRLRFRAAHRVRSETRHL